MMIGMIFKETEKNDNCQGLTNPATTANYRYMLMKTKSKPNLKGAEQSLNICS